jgi:PleD family two-component response regulator
MGGLFDPGSRTAVISDWMMPGMTGLELCRAVRSELPGPYTYFIMITSQGAADEVFEGMSAGVDDYLVKPLNTDDLEGRLIAAQRVTSLHRELAQQRTTLEDVNHELTDIARRDPLTGLGNRRALDEDLALLEARVSRYGHQYCMALVDVDHFKSFNDTYGHQAGDEILQAVASELTREARRGVRPGCRPPKISDTDRVLEHGVDGIGDQLRHREDLELVDTAVSGASAGCR